MKELSEKIRLIYKRYLIVSLSSIAVYTFLNWLIFIRFQLISVDEFINQYLLSVIFPAIALLIWVRPRVKLLNLKVKRGNWVAFYMYITIIFTGVSSVIAQTYLSTAAGKLTVLNNIWSINNTSPTKYYELSKYYIDKKDFGIMRYRYVNTDSHGHKNSVFTIYIVIPILDQITDTMKGNCMAWIGIRYNHPYNNELVGQELESEWQSFVSESEENFNSRSLQDFVYLDRVGNSMQKTGFSSAIKNCRMSSLSEVNIFTAVNEPFEKRNGNTLTWFFIVFLFGSAVWFGMILIPSFDPEQLQKIREGKPQKKDMNIRALFSFFIPRQNYFLTPVLIDLNCIIFLVMFFSGLGFISFEPSVLIKWGGNYGPLTTNGEWWRLVTSTFLHGGILHLVFNMYALLFVGLFLEPVLGSIKLGVIYIITGTIASATSLWWHGNMVAVGASGAIFGMYGIFLAFLLTKMFPKNFGKVFLISTLLFIGYNLIMGLSGNIDNSAHIGGLLSGFIIGLCLYPFMKDNKQKHWEMFHESKEKLESLQASKEDTTAIS